MKSWANIAKFGKAKNLEGGLSVIPAEGLPFLLSRGLEVTFVPPVLELPRKSKVSEIQQQGNNRYVVYFEDIPDKTTAQLLEGHYCLVRRSDLPEGFDRGEHDNLINLVVVDEAEGELGPVIRVEENPAHPLLVVEAGKGSLHYIPLVDEFITSVDEAAGVIRVALPAGLLDL